MPLPSPQTPPPRPAASAVIPLPPPGLYLRGGVTMAKQRVDEIVRYADGRFPLHGRVGLCRRCGGDPAIATGTAAIGTMGCTCGVNLFGRPDRVMPLDVTTEVGETREE
mgnify:FL=1